MARLLLNHDVDPNIQRDDLWSSLHLASANGHFKIAGRLVQRGARVDVFNGKQKLLFIKKTVTREKLRSPVILMNLDESANCGQQRLDPIARRVATWAPRIVSHCFGEMRVEVLDKGRVPAKLNWRQNGQADVAKLIAGNYKADANIRNKIRSTTDGVAQYEAGEDGR